MNTTLKILTAASICALVAAGAHRASAQTAPAHVHSVQEVAGSTPFLPLTDEPPPKLFVDAPIAHRLAHGAVLIPYRTENFRILPVFGPSADNVSPRAGHLHVTIDDLPWHIAEVGDNHTIVVVGLPPGPHKVLIELASPSHQVFTGQTVSFTIPADAYVTPAHAH
jgi:hypothetical protein